MKKIFYMIAAVLLAASCCGTKKGAASLIPGHYAYQHGWEYETKEGYVSVHETGTMDYCKDGTALDSACQVYTVTRPDRSVYTITFNYVSPSRWRAEGEDFYFAGIADSFRMEVLDIQGPDKAWGDKFAHRMMKNVGSTIDRETKFHIARLTRREFVWSYTYPDGHTDTWEFRRQVGPEAE